MVEKYRTTNGQVAVLIAPGFGAGWSTWNDCDFQEFLLFDKTLVGLALTGANEDAVQKYLAEVFPSEEYICTLGWEDVTVEYLDEGTQFIVEEYDGNEYLQFLSETRWKTA